MTANESDQLQQAAETLAAWLRQHPAERLVLAESCTAGLVAASLGTVPGISQSLCGSFVTYRESTKLEWLGIDPKTLSLFSAVSADVTDQMALGALHRTKEASWSVAVTGHLGPDAPGDLDGQVFIAVAKRGSSPSIRRRHGERLPPIGRLDRQRAAARLALVTLAMALAGTE